MYDFYSDIKKFNEIYKLDSNNQPQEMGVERIENFKDILQEELQEADELIARYRESLNGDGRLKEEARLAILTELSDWLGDIIVYCSSEARRWGLPMERILKVIMESNFSKLDADGQPIYDERGKVLKGPHYWKPEGKIEQLLKSMES